MKDGEEALPDDDGGVLVESGTFKVDRLKAIENLAEFRDRDTGPVVFLARAAAASGASHLRVAWDGPVLTVAFDGRPFSRKELGDPYAALFEAKPHPAARLLTLAMLHTYRPGLKSVEVAAGAGGKGYRLYGTEAGHETLEDLDSAQGGTLARFSCARRDEGLLGHTVPAAQIACRPQSHFWGRLPSSFFEDGALTGECAPGQAGPGEILKDPAGGPRVHISFLPPPESRGVIDLYLHGVYAGRIRTSEHAPDVVGKVDDPRLRLNVSQTSLVRSSRLNELRKQCATLAWELGGQVAAETRERLPETARLMTARADLRELWRRRFSQGSEAELGEAGRTTEEERVFHDAAATAWLRSLYLNFRERAPKGVRSALDAAPLFLGSGLAPLDAAGLKAISASPGLVAKSAQEALDAGSKAWCETTAAETDLRRILKGL